MYIHVVCLRGVYVYVRPYLPGLCREYTKQYSLIPRAMPEGLMNIAECIH